MIIKTIISVFVFIFSFWTYESDIPNTIDNRLEEGCYLHVDNLSNICIELKGDSIFSQHCFVNTNGSRLDCSESMELFGFTNKGNVYNGKMKSCLDYKTYDVELHVKTDHILLNFKDGFGYFGNKTLRLQHENKCFNYSRPNKVLINKKNPDVSIGEIQLLNPENIKVWIGEGSLNMEDEGNEYPYINLVNQERSVVMKMVFYPGSSKYEFSRFILSTYKGSIKGEKTVDDFEMKTNNGIYIGMSEEALLKKIDKTEFNVTHNTNLQKEYSLQINDLDTSTFLRAYNMPDYVATYYVSEGVVVKIDFGFINP